MRGPAFYRAKAGRRDANHAAIRDGLRALGHFVVDLAGVGDGVPDLCVYPRAMADDAFRDVVFMMPVEDPPPVWLEVKVAKGKLRDSQLDWRAAAESRGLKVRVARTLDEALEALR